MKNVRRIDDLLFTLMRITVIQCFLACLFMGMSLAHDGRGQSALSQKVSLNAENQDIKKILRQLEKQTNVTFVFSSKLIQSERKATIKVQSSQLSTVLDQLLKPLQLNYKATDNLIVIKPDRTTDKVSEVIENKPDETVKELIDRTISGTVKEENGTALPGVSVVLKGSQVGASSDTDGKFSLTAPNGEATLVFSFVGFLSIEVIVPNSQSQVDVTLKVDNKALEEVVVVGYGTQRKESLTGAIATVTSKDLDRVHGGSTVSSGLAGKIPGVTFRMPDGRPGASATVQIRNMGNPLFVIDGIQQDAGQFNNLSPNDVESITVLKDASAAIYGVRAANGVVVVTTKRGKNGTKNTVNLDAYYGVQNWSRFPNVVNDSYQWMAGKAEAEMNQYGKTSITQAELEKYRTGTEPGYQTFNWKDFIVKRNSPLSSINLNMTGGSDKISYYISATRLSQNSVLGREFTFERSNIQSNVDAKITDNLKIGVQINGRIEIRDQPGIPGGDDYWLPRFAILRNRPFERPYANDNPLYLNDIKHNETNWAYNNKKLGGYQTDIWRVLQSNMNAEYKIPGIKGLVAKGMYSYYIADQVLNGHEYTYQAYTYNPSDDTYKVTGGSTNPWRERRTRKIIRNVYQGQLNYNNTFGKNTFGATFVAERQEERDQEQWAHSVPSTNVLPLMYFATMDTYDDKDNQLARIGYIGRVNYNYDNKYYVELSARRDASWKFAPDRRVGYFPSASAGWRVTEEQFIKNIIGDHSILDDLKIRGSYGVLGDDDIGIGPYDYLPGYNYNQGNAILSGNAVVTSRDKGQIINNISWFKSKITDVGADFSLLGTKLTGTVDYFYRLRTGLRGRKYDILVPSELGYSLPDENVNSDSQRGWEGALTYNGKAGDISYSVGGNVSFSRSKFISSYKPIFNNSWDQYRNSSEGRYSSVFWGYECIGQFQSQQQINEYLVNVDGQGNRTLLPGDLIYKDINGDAKIDDLDQRPIGYTTSGQPNINFGLNFAVSWKGISFNADFSGGAMYSWNQSWEQRWAYQNDGALNSIFLDRWHRADPFDLNSEWIPGKYPALRYNDGGHSNYNKNSTFWLHNVKYIRARTIELGYSLPKSVLEKLKIQRARVYINGYNLFSIDNLKKFGVDPEIADDNGLQYPQNKFVNVGISLSI
ncbi:TonB-dependent receptor [Dyadobacter psychrotolerans]|uniref:TonB-dependent receptor n=1 Tax=Dyadobacter psychrotolerans TaxID=2541721 RepID=UPI001E58DF9C|nr:TonB-dependent receptor [Dyadobacter psychrotolerans]